MITVIKADLIINDSLINSLPKIFMYIIVALFRIEIIFSL